MLGIQVYKKFELSDLISFMTLKSPAKSSASDTYLYRRYIMAFKELVSVTGQLVFVPTKFFAGETLIF